VLILGWLGEDSGSRARRLREGKEHGHVSVRPRLLPWNNLHAQTLLENGHCELQGSPS